MSVHASTPNPTPTAQAAQGRPVTRRTSAIEPPAPAVSSASKIKSGKETPEGKDKKDKKDNAEGAVSKDAKEKSVKEDEHTKFDVALEFKNFRIDLGKMLKESEDRMGKMLKDSESRMTDKLSSIENKFSAKIEGLREEMKSEMHNVKEEIEHTKVVVNKEVSMMKETVTDMEKSVQDNSDRMSDIEKKQKEIISDIEKGQKDKLQAAKNELDGKIKELDKKLMLLEKQDRKYNLLFYGFEEVAGEDVYKTVRQSLIHDLELDEERVRNMYFAAGHRVPTKAPGPKPIIVRCTSLEDRELILSESNKYGGKKKRVVVDLPKSMKEERSRLAKIAYEIRKAEEIHTRIRDKGLDVFLEVRNDVSEKWVKRVV